MAYNTGLSDILRSRVPGVSATGLAWPKGTPSPEETETAERALAESDVDRSRQDMQAAQAAYAQAQQAAPTPVATPVPTAFPSPYEAPALVAEPDRPRTSAEFIDWIKQSDPELAYLYEQQASQQAAATEAEAGARTTAEGLISSYKKDVSGLQMPERPTMERPAPLELPAPPSMAARPFGTAKPGEPVFETLNRTLAMLGLLGTMGAGVMSNYAQGALASYSGALAGWAEGDTKRAENEWKDYSHKIDQMKANHESLMDEWRDAWKTYGYDQDTLKVKLGIIAAEHGMDKEEIAIAFRDPDKLAVTLDNTTKTIAQLRKDRHDLAKQMLLEEGKDRRALLKARETVRETPNQWIADMNNQALTPEQRANAKTKYDAYVEGEGTKVAARREQQPLDVETRNRIAAMDQSISAVKDLAGFSKEFASFVGAKKFAYEAAMATYGNTGIVPPGFTKESIDRFAEFKRLNGIMEKTKFAFGGKQLTEGEQRVVEAFVPTGREVSSVEYEKKLSGLYEVLRQLRNSELSYAQQGRGALKPTEAQGAPAAPAGSVRWGRDAQGRPVRLP